MRWIYSHRRIIALLFVTVIVLIFVSRVFSMTVEDIISYTPASPLLAALVLIAIYCLKSVVMVFPIVLLYTSSGVLFTPFWGIVVTLVGSFCELTIGYLLGKKMGRDKVLEMTRKNKKLERFMTFHEQNSAATCFLARILPIPLDLVSMLFGASGMQFIPYSFFSLLGLCPFLIPTVLAGNAIENPWSTEFLLPFALSLLIASGVFLLFRWLQKQKHTKEDSPS